MRQRTILTLLWLLSALTGATAQEFFNLTAEDVRIDSVLPRFGHAFELGTAYADSTYTVSIDYPEFIDMPPTDVARYHRLRRDTVGAMPAVEQYIGVSRRQGTLYVSFCPIVFREGRFQKLVSFKLSMSATAAQPAPESQRTQSRQARQAGGAASRYADHSVLSSGRWAKISVAQTGIHQLTDAVIRRAGFSQLSKVRIFGYGGALQPERLTGDYLQATDDLHEVPTCTVNGRKLFWGVGPVSWSSDTAPTRTRNPYSDYGCYFITEDDEEPLTMSAADFLAAGYPQATDYHSLYEVDNFAWYHTGRNLYDDTTFGTNVTRQYQLAAYSDTGKLTVVMSYDDAFEATVRVNGEQVGTLSKTGTLPKYAKADVKEYSFSVSGLQATNTVSITQTSGGNLHLDYITLCSTSPRPMGDLETATFPEAAYVYNITNQDHHADTAVDMVIIIPTTQKLLAQAQRLKQLHEEKDSLRVRIVPADELFNEYSSGTPDANAYRRYLKMLYDRAETEADMPRFLLLLGDGAWDNRMLSTNWRSTSPDDFLLCYESENSMSETYSYVTDDYYCMMDDGEGGNLLSSDKADVAVGRLSARTADEAKILVDKIYTYRNNEKAGAWQNTLCFMADDGNGTDQTDHMRDTESVIARVQPLHPSFHIKKIYWDVYERQTSATGNSYPDVSRLIKQQMQSGALIMNYQGHGADYQISHERVLTLADFKKPAQLRLPMWITASCDITPFDSQEDNIGEAAMFNETGGAIAFLGTTRTVFQPANAALNRAVVVNLLGSTNGRRNTIGEAVRLTKNALITSSGSERDQSENKLHYVLLGDPALTLAAPERNIVIDSINGKPVGQDVVAIPTGGEATLSGHIEGVPDFDGTVTLMVRDVEETIVCRQNYVAPNIDKPYTFRDRQNTLYQGSNYVKDGRFSCTFAVPKDISFAEGEGQVLLHAVNNEKTLSAHGHNEGFALTGKDNENNDGIGPNIYCYLNSTAFTNGDAVNATPYFHAELNDKDGINAAGNGIGHNLELVIDGDINYTYHLEDYFEYTFGDYRSGTVGYSLPELSAGSHRLTFRAWDILNNSSTAELTFVVDPQQRPKLTSVICTQNPASTSTSFVINHDRTGSQMDVVLQVFDASGRQLWQHSESGVTTDQTYTVNWDLTTSSGSQLRTGVYLYRILVSSDGSSQATNAQKLIILRK